MLVKVNTPIKDIDGRQMEIKSPMFDEQNKEQVKVTPVTVKVICVRALIGRPQETMELSRVEHLRRLNLAQAIYDADEIEINSSDILLIEGLVKANGILIAGQVMKALGLEKDERKVI